MSKDYKDTLLMMTTPFNMKANLPLKEPEILKKWDEINLYQKVLEKNKNNKSFVLHDGPPYANGNIHVGHALNKILKDIIVRYKTMKGYYAPYIPGWDTHGLPIETALTKDKKIKRKEIDIADFRDLCYQYALKQVETQKKQFQRLGVLGDWENSYLTLDKKFEAEQIKVFAHMAEKGLIYKGLKPVFWSPSSESALAEAEIEYYDIESTTIYLAFKVIEGKSILKPNDEIVIWTTTPWTIPANLAVSVNPTFDYVLVKCNNRRLVVAKQLLEKFLSTIECQEYQLLKTFKGVEMEYITYQHPLFDKICPIILGEHVTLDAGTGLVHTAPGHGDDDFNIGRLYQLECLCPVDNRGFMTEEAGEFQGLFYEVANEQIVNKLNDTKALLHKNKIIHSYPHDWRTKKPVIFRATPQWFASIESLKADILKSIVNVKWLPLWGEVRLTNMIKDRKEWCISRQRAWGVPIPVFYAEDGTPLMEQQIMLHISKLFEEFGSAIWFKLEAKDLLPAGYTNPHSPNGVFYKEKDIMDVWFDSGSSHHGVLKSRGLAYPADLYIEGSDQYRGWFNSSLSTGVAMTGVAPYKMVVSHGFVLDGEGEKQSKSLGNTVDPQKVCQNFGADILRLWVSSCEYTADVRINEGILNQNAEAYRKIRNTFRFLLGNLFDFDYQTNQVNYENMPEVDQYMMCALNQYIKKVTQAYDEYRFDDVYRLTLNYISNTLSSFYMDFTKDIIYIDAKNSLARRSIQTVFYNNLTSLVCILTPIIPFTCEEVYSYMDRDKESVYLLDMPNFISYPNQEQLLLKYQKFMILRNDILKAIEEARNNKIIGKSLNAKIVIYPSSDSKKLISEINADLRQLFIVSEFVVSEKEIAGIKLDSGIINISAREGIICARCWQVVDSVNADEICQRCNEVVKKLEE